MLPEQHKGMRLVHNLRCNMMLQKGSKVDIALMQKRFAEQEELTDSDLDQGPFVQHLMQSTDD